MKERGGRETRTKFILGQRRRVTFIQVFFIAMAIVLISQLCINVLPVAAQPEYGKIIWFVQVPPQGPDPPPPPEEKIIWFVQIEGPGGPQTPFIDLIEPCKWYRVVATEPPQPDFTPPECSWWHIFYPEQMYCIYFHVDMTSGLPGEFHIDKVLPERRMGPVVPPAPEAQAEWIPPIEPITKIEPCKWYRVIDTEPYQPGFTPPECSWWHIFWPAQLYCTSFHVDKSTDQMFHIDKVLPAPIPVVDPPVDIAQGEWKPPVGGVWTPVDTLGLLVPYIGLVSTILVATAATAIYAKRVKRRKEK